MLRFVMVVLFYAVHIMLIIHISCTGDAMQGEGFLSDILFNGVSNEVDGDLVGLNNLDIAMNRDNDVQEVEEVEASATQKKFSKRTKNFFFKEDEVICDGWLKISKDPIHGANQSRASFWRRVHAYFVKNKSTAADRSQSSIMHRWLTIQASVNKYCSCVEAIERRNQSGTTIENKVFDICFTYFSVLVHLKILYTLVTNLSCADRCGLQDVH
jgi:hypothetical protein